MLKVDQWELTHEDIENDTLLGKNIFPYLTGFVFHKTDQRGYDGICQSGFIENNHKNQHPYSTGLSKISYGNKNGYVCLFDFTIATSFEISEALEKLNFLPSCQDHYTVYYFILEQQYHSNLIPRTAAMTKGEYKGDCIPTECWFPRDIPIEYINKIKKVFIKDDN